MEKRHSGHETFANIPGICHNEEWWPIIFDSGELNRNLCLQDLGGCGWISPREHKSFVAHLSENMAIPSVLWELVMFK